MAIILLKILYKHRICVMVFWPSLIKRGWPGAGGVECEGGRGGRLTEEGGGQAC